MANGDILTFILDASDDGTIVNNALTAATIVVEDDITMTKLQGNKVLVVVVKAA